MGRQIVLRCELLVECPLCQTRTRHQILQADAIKAVPAEQPTGGINDRLTVFFRLNTTDPHNDPSEIDCVQFL